MTTTTREHDPVVIDLERRQLTLGERTFPLPDDADLSSHLERYVRAVNRLRSRPMRDPGRLRRADTEALAHAFELDIDEVTALLTDLIGQEAAHRRRALALRSGAGTLATVVIVGAAAAAISQRGSDADAIVLTADDVTAQTEQAPAAQLPPTAELPPTATFRGPDLTPSSAPPRGSGDAKGNGSGAEGGGAGAEGAGPASSGKPASGKRSSGDQLAEFEDETRLADAVVIERDDTGDSDDSDEQQERSQAGGEDAKDGDDAGSDGDGDEGDADGGGEDETNIDASGEHLIEATPEDFED